jgi:hypothetical protein
MKKDLLLITSHCSTPEKKHILLNLLKSLQGFRKKFDILVTSHLPLDPWFFEYFDYFFFDKNNRVLTDQEYTQNSWFQPFDNYVIWSSYADYGNTMVAIWDLIIPSLSVAKSHGYEKIHYIEYDTLFMNDEELNNNSKLLDEYDYVIYNSNSSHALLGAFFSFKLKSIISEWEKIDHEYLMNLIEFSYPKTPEYLFFKMISKQKNYYRKEIDILINQGIKINLSRGSKFYWDVPFYEPKTNSLQFVSYNNNSEKYKLRIILNETELINVESLPEQNWKIFTLLDDFNLLTSLKVFRDENKILDLNFESQDFKNRFIKYNSLLGNSSIDPNIII